LPFFLWESIGQYPRGVGEGDVFQDIDKGWRKGEVIEITTENWSNSGLWIDGTSM
jgi:hypothetical protein